MPRGDRTGPAGMGPMTGRGAGYCAGRSVPGFMSRGFRGRGRGGGWGWRHWYRATGVPGWQRAASGLAAFAAVPFANAPVPQAPGREVELNMLKQQAEDLNAALENIQKRISELETKAKSQNT